VTLVTLEPEADKVRHPKVIKKLAIEAIKEIEGERSDF
jgi:hypothetical protein